MIASSHHFAASADSPEDSLLLVQNVTMEFQLKKRTIRALDGMSFQLQPHRITGLIGPDGAGKTTLMRLIAGLLVANKGRISVLGNDPATQSLAVQATIGYMPQRFGLYEDLTVQENLDLYADLQGVPRKERSPRYKQLMHMTNLAPFTRRLAGRLSGGMKQKLGLACTLIRTPRLLLLDEPTVGVDPVSRRELWQIINQLVQEYGTSVLLSTAYLDEAERCSEVLMMHHGRLLAQDDPKKLAQRMHGRTYLVDVSSMINRDIQSCLAVQDSVVDAIIQGPHVRLVMKQGIDPDMSAMLPDASDSSIRSTPPRFEDTFIDLLHHEQSAGKSTPLNVDVQTHARDSRENRYAIRVENLQRKFGDFYAVREVSFEVKHAEIFGLLGANGAGKSTTFRMLCGLLPLSAGSVSVAGVDLRHAAAAARARIGYMSQKFSLYGRLTVRQNLNFFSAAYGLRGSRRRARIDWAMDQFELREFADSPSANLPLGHKQRLSMSCALLHQPRILFLDEPTSGVDPLARREFWHRINDLARHGVTVMVTTHFMEEAEYCDRLAIMVAGRILAMGPPQQIKADQSTPEHPDPTMEDAFIRLIESDKQE